MKIYLSGRITGKDIELVKLCFESAETRFVSQGHEVVNPLKIEHNHDKSWESYMKADIAELLKCDAIYMIGDWYKSRGAMLELNIANELKLKTIFQS